MECKVCGNPVPKGSDFCSSKCLFKAKPSGAKSSKSVLSVMDSMFSESQKEKLISNVEISMIRIKHRWMKRRNAVAGKTVISFNEKGIASIKDLGSARDDIAVFVSNSKGLVSYLTYASEKKPPAQKPLEVDVSSEPVVEVLKKKEEVKEVKKEEVKEVKKEEVKEVEELQEEEESLHEEKSVPESDLKEVTKEEKYLPKKKKRTILSRSKKS